MVDARGQFERVLVLALRGRLNCQVDVLSFGDLRLWTGLKTPSSKIASTVAFTDLPPFRSG